MNSLSLITKGLLGDVIKRYYTLPFNITIDDNEKNVEVLIEDVNLLVTIEQPILDVQAGQESIEVTLDQPGVTVNT